MLIKASQLSLKYSTTHLNCQILLYQTIGCLTISRNPDHTSAESLSSKITEMCKKIHKNELKNRFMSGLEGWNYA